MIDLVDTPLDEVTPLPGFRLDKFEIYNWGTFDKTVHTIRPSGSTTLLVGENGSGKSTIVDALLTLLVKPQTRNYNVAAGGGKSERDEKTYIRGAYDRVASQTEGSRVKYLRSSNGHYTALLACFKNAHSGEAFSLCQVLYLTADNSLERIYAIADGEHGIVTDLANVESAKRIAQHMRERGFRTTSSYKQYFGWLQRKTGFREKAMDIFNQTVAVKDVQSLDEFIRRHMLQRKPWKEKIDRLLHHFTELNEAHHFLLKLRTQHELLEPIIDAGRRYSEMYTQVDLLKSRLDACPLFFANETIRLLTPAIEADRERIDELRRSSEQIDTAQDSVRESIARISYQINSGNTNDPTKIKPSADSSRTALLTRDLQRSLENERQLLNSKLKSRERFTQQLAVAGLSSNFDDPKQFAETLNQVRTRRSELLKDRENSRERLNTLQQQMGNRRSQVSTLRSESRSLHRQTGNLPESLVEIRRTICEAVGLEDSSLPFAAELIAIASDQTAWEDSIELVLNGLGRSLLVPEDHYEKVAKFVEHTRLADSQGRGQRLIYLRIPEVNKQLSSDVKSTRNSLFAKLVFRDEHPLSNWLRTEVKRRFNFTTCESVEEFHATSAPAMTKNCHFKSSEKRHEKDDRFVSKTGQRNKQNMILGWENTRKRKSLEESIQQAESLARESEQIIAREQQNSDEITSTIESLNQALLVGGFENVDAEKHSAEIRTLESELQQKLAPPKLAGEAAEELARLNRDLDQLKRQRDEKIIALANCESKIDAHLQAVTSAQTVLTAATEDGSLSIAKSHFNAIAAELPVALTVDNISSIPNDLANHLRETFESKRQQMEPLAKDVVRAMTRFLKKFPEELADLDADVESIPAFDAIYKKLAADDLPRFEQRFKQRLNEKVLHEIGLLHGDLENDRQEIKEKINQLNAALKRLTWKQNPNSHMQLEITDAKDREILDFRKELGNCLNEEFSDSEDENEEIFRKLQRLIGRLQDSSSDRWRQKVIDVRNWFHFAAREFVTDSGESKSYYDGGSGQSGGEKGKLAFLVLAAAISYQYDLDPDAIESDRFHFVMVDEMFSRSDDKHAEYALDLFERFGLQLLVVAPLDAKARVTEPYVGTYVHVVKNKKTNRSELLTLTAEQLQEQATTN